MFGPIFRGENAVSFRECKACFRKRPSPNPCLEKLPSPEIPQSKFSCSNDFCEWVVSVEDIKVVRKFQGKKHALDSRIFQLKKSQGHVKPFYSKDCHTILDSEQLSSRCFVSTVPAEFHVMARKSDTSPLQHNLRYMIQDVQSQGQDRQGGRPVHEWSDFWYAFQLIHRVLEGHWLEDKDKTHWLQESFSLLIRTEDRHEGPCQSQ